VDFPIVSATTLGKQLLDPNPVRVGGIRLRLPQRCVHRPFRAVVRGVGMTRVDFRLDGRRLAHVSAPDARGHWTARVNTRRLRAGLHRLSAAVWVSRGAKHPAKRLRARFRVCG
jgi:hypothetical protein